MLNASVLDTEIFCKDYIVYRNDRSLKTSNKKRGGGVLIAVKVSSISSQIQLPHENIEMVCVKVSVKCFNVYLFCTYIPPNSSIETSDACSKNVEFILDKAGDRDQFLICGDFNLPDVKWVYTQHKTKIFAAIYHLQHTIQHSFWTLS